MSVCVSCMIDMGCNAASSQTGSSTPSCVLVPQWIYVCVGPMGKADANERQVQSLCRITLNSFTDEYRLVSIFFRMVLRSSGWDMMVE